MFQTSARPADDVEEVLARYGDQLYRICLVTLKHTADAEDAVQETLIRYLQKRPDFESGEHEKAWLIRVAVNCCRDMLRKRRYEEDTLDQLSAGELDETHLAVQRALLNLPEKFRILMTLHYVEGYSVAELGSMLHLGQSAVKMRLMKGRSLLRTAYEKEM